MRSPDHHPLFDLEAIGQEFGRGGLKAREERFLTRSHLADVRIFVEEDAVLVDAPPRAADWRSALWLPKTAPIVAPPNRSVQGLKGEVVADGGDWVEVRGHKKHVQGYLKEFLFEPGLVDAKIGSLSGGERSRLLLAREFARRSNLLVLDEPTNDLDIETLDLLQEVIADYEGTVLIVSHDRDFLDRTVTITLGLPSVLRSTTSKSTAAPSAVASTTG